MSKGTPCALICRCLSPTYYPKEGGYPKCGGCDHECGDCVCRGGAAFRP
jgi:hypothetical protein